MITSAASEVDYEDYFEIETQEADSIEKVVLVRPMSVTHHTDAGQRRVELNFSKYDYTLRARAPTYPQVAPQGYYMLFILNDRGVPSEAKFIRLR